MVTQPKKTVNTFSQEYYEDDDIRIRSGAEWAAKRKLCGTDASAPASAAKSKEKPKKKRDPKDNDFWRIKLTVAAYGKPFYVLDGHIWTLTDGRWTIDDPKWNSLWAARYNRSMRKSEETLLNQLFGFSMEAVMSQNYNTCSHYYERIGNPLDAKNPAHWVPFDLPRHQLLCRHGIYDALEGRIVDSLEGRIIYGDRCWMSPLDITEADMESAKKVETWLKERVPNDLERERMLELMAVQGLTPHAKVRNIILAYGDGGTGKSTTMKMLGQAASRGHVTETTLQDLVRSNFAFSSIEKAHFNVCDESSLTSAGTVEVLKRLSGGQVQIERKYAHARPAAISILFILTANKIPDLPDGSSAMTDRLVPVHFPQIYAGELDNKTMDNNALAQHPQLPGIFSYLFGFWLLACRKSVDEINRGSADWQREVGQIFASKVDRTLDAISELLEKTDNPDDKVRTRDIITALEEGYGILADAKDVAQYMRKLFGEESSISLKIEEKVMKGYRGYKIS